MKEKSIMNNKIILLFFIIPIFMPQSFAVLLGGVLEKPFLIWNIFNTAILILIFIGRRKLKSSLSWSFIFFWLLFLFCSLFSGNDMVATIKTWGGTAAPIVSFMLLSNIVFRSNFRSYINFISKYLFFLLLLNLFLLVIFHDGVASMQHIFTSGQISDSALRLNFMATDNTMIQFLIVTILLSELRYYYYKKSLYRKLVWITSGLTVVIIWSGTGVVGYLVYLLSSIILIRRKSNFSINTAYVIGIISFFLIVIFRLQAILKFLIVNILGKNISLSNRVYIWDIAYTKISEHPWLGWGNIGKGWIIEYNWYNYYAHNLVLDVLIQGGVITLVSICLLLNHARVALRRQDDKYLESLLSCCIVALFMMNVTESQFTSVYFYIPFILAWLLSVFNRESSKTLL